MESCPICGNNNVSVKEADIDHKSYKCTVCKCFTISYDEDYEDNSDYHYLSYLSDHDRMTLSNQLCSQSVDELKKLGIDFNDGMIHSSCQHARLDRKAIHILLGRA